MKFKKFSIGKKLSTTVVLCIIGVAVLFFILNTYIRSENQIINTVVYSCNEGKIISATYYEGSEIVEVLPGEPPIPTGSVQISLNGAASTTLQQTISASGIRYANEDESFVFWSKGNEAIVMRNNDMDLEYTNCVALQRSSI